MKRQSKNIEQGKQGLKNQQQTKQSFIDKLRQYEKLGDIQANEQIDYDFNRTSASFNRPGQIQPSSTKVEQDFQKLLLRSRGNISYQGKQENYLMKTNIKHSNQYSTLKEKISPSSTLYPQTNYNLIQKKFNTQNKYVQKEFQSIINNLSHIDNKFSSYHAQHNSGVRQNFLQLEQLQKYLITTQRIYQENSSKLVEKKSQTIISEIIDKSFSILKETHHKSKQNKLKNISYVYQQSLALKNGIQNESQLCQQTWCDQLDRINQQIFNLSTLLTQTRIQQNDKKVEQQWKIKQMKFNCQQILQKQIKERKEQDRKIHSILEKIIQNVGVI